MHRLIATFLLSHIQVHFKLPRHLPNYFTLSCPDPPESGFQKGERFVFYNRVYNEQTYTMNFCLWQIYNQYTPTTQEIKVRENGKQQFLLICLLSVSVKGSFANAFQSLIYVRFPELKIVQIWVKLTSARFPPKS